MGDTTLDIIAAKAYSIKAGQEKEVNTEMMASIVKEHDIQIRSTTEMVVNKSLFALNYLIRVSNGKLHLMMSNQSDKEQVIRKGDVIAHLTLDEEN